MKNFKIKDCDVNITNNSKCASDEQCEIFVDRYLSYYLAEEKFGNYLFIPSEVKNKTPLNVVVIDYNDMIQFYINADLHIEIIKNDYHDMKLCCEENGTIHGLFFKELRTMKCTGLELLEVINSVEGYYDEL